MADPLPQRRLYGRKQTRALGRERREAFDRLLPRLKISPEESPFRNNVWLEIGFGNGEHLAALMRRHPERNFIGAEPFVNGMAAFLKEIENDPHGNIRVWMDDVMLLVPSLPDHYLEGIYILNPDPWPKKRHHKRRLVNQDNLGQFARILKPGGILVMATDVADLAEWMATQAMLHPAFAWTAEKRDDWTIPPPGWIQTRYQEKGAARGRRQTYLIFRRI